MAQKDADADRELLALARAVIDGTPAPQENRDWAKGSREGAFVTAYRKPGDYRSANVWCCMSNGEFAGAKSAWRNVLESAEICRTRDSRRTGERPQEVTVTLLQVQPWARVHRSEMAREKRRAIQARFVDEQGRVRHSAIYLPSVWEEEPGWSAQDLVDSLTHKATGVACRQCLEQDRGLRRELYEAVARDIMPESPATKGGAARKGRRHWHRQGDKSATKKGAASKTAASSTTALSFTQVKAQALERGLAFYLAHAQGATLAYLFYPGGRQKTDYDKNHEYLARTYSDVAAMHQLAARLGAPDKARPFVAAAGGWPAPSLPDAVSRLLFLLDTDQAHGNRASEVRVLASRILDGRAYDRADDISFSSPQALLALGRAYRLVLSKSDKADSNLRRRIRRAFADFRKRYVDEGRGKAALSRDGAFAANWIAQALLSRVDPIRKRVRPAVRTFVSEKLLPVCRAAIRGRESVTVEACAMHALVVARKLDVGREDGDAALIEATVRRWHALQAQWLAESGGGFRYRADDGSWYRTDVTSHVVAVLLLL